jgi:hypothetical protein
MVVVIFAHVSTRFHRYEVEAIVGKRKKNGMQEVLVKWVGFRSTDNTYVTAPSFLFSLFFLSLLLSFAHEPNH